MTEEEDKNDGSKQEERDYQVKNGVVFIIPYAMPNSGKSFFRKTME
jgi:hypothetical protein